MAKTLQELRKEAGYKSAKDFAEAIGMSESTYSRYESNPNNINMKAAIKLADFLHCSLDMVMGREPVKVEDMRGEVQKFYESLSNENKKLFDEFSAFILTREKQAEEDRRNQRLIENINHFKYYQRKYESMLAEDEKKWKTVFYMPPKKKRDNFEKFLRAQIEEEMAERLKGLEEAIVGEEIMSREELRQEYLHTHHTDVSTEEEPMDEWVETRLREWIDHYRKSEIEVMEEGNKELIQGVMDAYDKANATKERGFEYGIVSLNNQ